MIKQALEHLGYSLFAELALLLFALIFIAVVLRTLLTRREITNEQAKIVLGDKTENPS